MTARVGPWTSKKAKLEEAPYPFHPLSLKEAVKGLLETKPDKGKSPGQQDAEKASEGHQGAEEGEEG